jgi:hypothetical protein
MSEQEKHHWKKWVNTDYIGAYSLDGKDLTVRIVSVKQQLVKGENGKEETCTVAALQGQKSFIINRTNAKMITKLFNSPYIEDWVGKYITLYPTTTKVAGETVECLRIRSVVPQIKKTDTAGAAAKLRACTTLEQLQQTYAALAKEEQTATVSVKDEMKTKLTPPAK